VELGVTISSLDDALLNLFLVLYAVESSSRRGYLYGRVKLQKLLFEAQKRMTERRLRALTYVFYRWKHGVYSPELDWGVKWLSKNGLVNVTEKGIEITETGRSLLREARELLELNKETVAIIDRMSEIYPFETGKIMKAKAYGTPAPATRALIEDVKKGEIVLNPLEDSKASKHFLIDHSWIRTLEILLEKESRESIEKAMSDARQGRIEPYRPVG